jgi:hypothetical protein
METVASVISESPSQEPGAFAGGTINSTPADAAGSVHVCQDPEFNAMVDMCHACDNPDASSALKEAADAPYRNVETSRWAVHHLLKYHYLPYWPRNVDRVFATVDIRTGQVIAACVFAFPCLRSHLREQVFGEVSPETLNRDFRQLVRWMVHPDHRKSGIGTELLRWSMRNIPQPIVEAMNRSWVPVKVFQELGMIERSDEDRHYYYRLKECRKRVDETKDVPAQVEPRQGEVLHTYPRLWVQKVRLAGTAEFVIQQPYEGAVLRTHAWSGGCYGVMQGSLTVQEVQKAVNFEEVTDAGKRNALLVRIAAGLPVASAN